MKDPKLVYDKKLGNYLALETDKSDNPFKNPMHYYAKAELNNDIVIDIGAYIGEYALYALNHGAKKKLYPMNHHLILLKF